jgi:hypothetical protein
MNQTIEGFLNFVRAGVELVEEKAVRLFTGDGFWRAEAAGAVFDLRDADEVLRGELAAQQRNAVETNGTGKLLDQRGFADAGSTPR